MGRDKAVIASQLGSAAKENLPPNMSKATVSVNSLFDQTDRLRKKNEETHRNVLGPRPAGISKPTAKEGFFAKYKKPKAPEHPVYTGFKQTLAEYRQGAAEAKSDGLQPVYEELIARVDGVDVRGRPLNTPGVPTEADIDALIAEEEDIYKPLDDDTLQLCERATGQVKDVRLGDTIQKFEAKSEKKREELAKLLEQLKTVNSEIAAAQKDAIRSEEVEVKHLRDELATQLYAFKDQALKIKQQAQAEVKAAAKEDKKAKKDWDAKIAALTE